MPRNGKRSFSATRQYMFYRLYLGAVPWYSPRVVPVTSALQPSSENSVGAGTLGVGSMSVQKLSEVRTQPVLYIAFIYPLVI